MTDDLARAIAQRLHEALGTLEGGDFHAVERRGLAYGGPDQPSIALTVEQVAGIAAATIDEMLTVEPSQAPNDMLIVRLRWPGMMIEGISDHHRRIEVEGSIRAMESHLGEAAIALRLYEESARTASDINSSTNWPPPENYEGWPIRYLQVAPSIHAKSFVYALDAVAKGLKVLRDSYSAEAPKAAGILEKWTDYFPGLQSIRDSAHHVEDRARGMVRDRKIQAHDVDMPGFKIVDSPNVTLLGGLFDSSYANTSASGKIESVEISAKSVIAAADFVQEVIDSFAQWSGPSSQTYV